VSGDHDERVTGALGTVRQLEAALETGSAAREAAEARLQEARAEAARVLAATRDDAAAAAAERRRLVLGAAADEAAAIQREGEARATRLGATARERREAVVDAALAVILPAVDASEP
jgi:vacuolar-type H+-ATPase subunit H